MEVNTTHYADLARHAIQPVLDGKAPNGTKPEDCGPWATVVDGVFKGYYSAGTDRARKVFNTLAAADQGITKMMASADQSAPKAHEWGTPLPFHSIELPEFPLDIFPDWLREYCEAVTETMQTPPDLAGMLALSVLSTACARRVGIQAWAGWREPINVYTVTSLPPASRKSPVFRAMMAPLVKFEQVESEKAEIAVAEAEARRDILKHQIEAAKRKAGNASGENATKQAFSEVDGLLGELRDMETPARLKLIVDDVTPEAVATILAEQGGRVSVLSPEGDIFGIMAGRYSAGPPNIGVYLKAHAGETVRIDRKTRSEHIKQAAITIGVTTQPEVMRTFGSNNAFRGQGLLARFFFALPRSTVGTRRSETEPMADQVRSTYFHRMMMLLENLHSVHSVHSVQGSNENEGGSVHNGNDLDHYDSNNITYIEISIEAKNRLKAFMDWIEPQLGDYGALHYLADWAGKLAGGALRIAGLLHMADTLGQNGRIGQISDNELARAIRLAHYLLPHAQAAYAEIGADPAIDAAKTILRWIEKTDARTFTRRECYRGVRGPLFKSADDCDPALRLLADHGYIREQETVERAGPGRKASQPYETNPAVLLGQNGQNGRNAPDQSKAVGDSGLGATYEPPTFRSIEGYD
jgi:replicative DNA helicase